MPRFSTESRPPRERELVEEWQGAEQATALARQAQAQALDEQTSLQVRVEEQAKITLEVQKAVIQQPQLLSTLICCSRAGVPLKGPRGAKRSRTQIK